MLLVSLISLFGESAQSVHERTYESGYRDGRGEGTNELGCCRLFQHGKGPSRERGTCGPHGGTMCVRLLRHLMKPLWQRGGKGTATKRGCSFHSEHQKIGAMLIPSAVRAFACEHARAARTSRAGLALYDIIHMLSWRSFCVPQL